MNSLVTFRKCTLTNEELVSKVDKYIDQLYQTGKLPGRHIPARPNGDLDLLVGELLVRFMEMMNNEQNVLASGTMKIQ